MKMVLAGVLSAFAPVPIERPPHASTTATPLPPGSVAFITPSATSFASDPQ